MDASHRCKTEAVQGVHGLMGRPPGLKGFGLLLLGGLPNQTERFVFSVGFLFCWMSAFMSDERLGAGE